MVLYAFGMIVTFMVMVATSGKIESLQEVKYTVIQGGLPLYYLRESFEGGVGITMTVQSVTKTTRYVCGGRGMLYCRRKQREEGFKATKHQQNIEIEKKRRSRIKDWLEAIGKGAFFVGVTIGAYLIGKKKSGQS